jgi:hypothetical protein
VPRFYFQLDGAERVADKHGRQFGDLVEAFRAANRLAREIAEVRPYLRGNTCVIMTERDRPDDLYCVSIQ